MIRQANTSENHAAELADLMEQLTVRLQAGGSIDWAEVERDHPEHAEELRKLFPTVALVADLTRSTDGLAAEGAPAELGELGDFRLLREVGRGGMGIVYEAIQLSLTRRVALKVLPFAATMDPRQLQRFRHEAQAAAMLHHPNIVPVHGVGCERGVHYYAMQLIEGRSLAAVIDEMRSENSDRKPSVAQTAAYPPDASCPLPRKGGGEKTGTPHRLPPSARKRPAATRPITAASPS